MAALSVVFDVTCKCGASLRVVEVIGQSEAHPFFEAVVEPCEACLCARYESGVLDGRFEAEQQRGGSK